MFHQLYTSDCSASWKRAFTVMKLIGLLNWIMQMTLKFVGIGWDGCNCCFHTGLQVVRDMLRGVFLIALFLVNVKNCHAVHSL